MERAIHRLIFGFCILSIVLFSIYRIFWATSISDVLAYSDSGESDGFDDALPSGLSDIHSQKTVGENIDKKVSSPVLDDWKPTTTPIEFAEQVDWFRGRGNFAFAGDDEYGSYDIDTLTQLSGAGDIHAMHVLAQLYLSEKYRKQYGLKYAEDMYWKAAVYGSSDALAELAIIEDSKRFGTFEDDTRKQIVESFAYYKTAEIRGDRFGYLTSGKSSLKIFNSPFTNEENKYIEEKARDIYEKMVREREALGLGPFDNSVPDSVKKLFDRLEAGSK